VLYLIIYICSSVSWYIITAPTTLQIIVGILATLAIINLSIEDLFKMSSPNAPRTPLKPTNKANGTPKSPESTKKLAATSSDGGNVVKKRIPSQNIKENAPEHKAASPQTPRPKAPKTSEDQLPQSPTPDRNSKRHSVTDAPPKFKAATPDQGEVAKQVVKKVKKTSPPADVGNDSQDQVNESDKPVKKTKKRVPKPQDEVDRNGVEQL
jgi:hypothetical protein